MKAVKAMGRGMVERHGGRPGRDVTEPAFTVRASAGGMEPGGFRWQPEEGDDVLYRNGSGKNAALRRSDAPAPTIMFGQRSNKVDWVTEEDDVKGMAQSGSASTVVDPRPATYPAPTVTGGGNAEWTSRLERAQMANDRAGDAVRVTPEEAAALQSYPADFDWRGAKTKRYLQIGNAVPPLLAQRVLEALWAEPAAELKMAA